MITVTEEAKQYLIRMLKAQNRLAVLLGLDAAGCTGFKYTWTPVASNIADNVIDLDDDYSLVFDKTTALNIFDSTIDIVIEGLNKRLTVTNPNVDHMCGCGESVSFKNV